MASSLIWIDQSLRKILYHRNSSSMNLCFFHDVPKLMIWNFELDELSGSLSNGKRNKSSEFGELLQNNGHKKRHIANTIKFHISSVNFFKNRSSKCLQSYLQNITNSPLSDDELSPLSSKNKLYCSCGVGICWWNRSIKRNSSFTKSTLCKEWSSK